MLDHSMSPRYRWILLADVASVGLPADHIEWFVLQGYLLKNRTVFHHLKAIRKEVTTNDSKRLTSNRRWALKTRKAQCSLEIVTEVRLPFFNRI